MSGRTRLVFGEHRIFVADETYSDGMLVLRRPLRLGGAFLIFMAYGYVFHNPQVFYDKALDVVVCPQPFFIVTGGTWPKLTTPSGARSLNRHTTTRKLLALHT